MTNDGYIARESMRLSCRAMLLQAMSDIRSKKDSVRSETIAWVKGARSAITFEMCCQVLDIDLESARARILAKGE
jgi:hypothetical protein